MAQNVDRDERIVWAFGIAAGLVAIGAFAPLAFSIGTHSRIGVVVVPFAVAAVALAVNAFMYRQGRTVAVALYFVAGLAIVYGILAMLAVPLQLAVIGTCPDTPANCPAGFEPPMTSGENSGLGTASLCGILAIFVGFYGLLVLYRRGRPTRGEPEPRKWPAAAPVQPAQAVAEPVAPPDPVPAAPPVGPPASPVEVELKELPAPEELKELPPPA